MDTLLSMLGNFIRQYDLTLTSISLVVGGVIVCAPVFMKLVDDWLGW